MNQTQRKLSKLQKTILQLAAESRAKGRDNRGGVESMDCTTREILGALGQSPAHRAAVSRAIARLEMRGLVEYRQFLSRRSGINLTPNGWQTVIKVPSRNFDNRFATSGMFAPLKRDFGKSPICTHARDTLVKTAP